MGGWGTGSPPTPMPHRTLEEGEEEICKPLPAEKPGFVNCNTSLVSEANSRTEAVPGCAKGLCVRISERK